MGNDNYIDTVVLVEKPDSGEPAHAHDVAGRPKVPVVNDVRLTRVGEVDMTSLTIDESLDGGGESYNSTGKHCILKIKE